jgi:hypothetical protein
MQLEILTFCDAAAEYGGRLNVLGATDTIVAPSAPFRYNNCALAVRLRAARVEHGQHSVRLMIIDADGEPLLNIDGPLQVNVASSTGGSMHLIVSAQNLEFKRAGEYAIEVAVDGIQLGSSPLFVRVQDSDGEREIDA